MKKHVKQGEMLPPWYGPAYYSFENDTFICLPIPLNLFYALYKWFSIAARHLPARVCREPRLAYGQGLLKGLREPEKQIDEAAEFEAFCKRAGVEDSKRMARLAWMARAELALKRRIS